MVLHLWSVLCRISIIDQDSDDFSLIETLDYILLKRKRRSDKSPAKVPFSFDWVTLWRRENVGKPALAYGKDAITRPTGEIISENEYKIDLRKHESVRYKRRMPDFEAPEYGDYRFVTQMRLSERDAWTTVSDFPLFIDAVPPRKRKKKDSAKTKDS